jgi:hypothetical protein
MAMNMEVTNNATNGIVIADDVYDDETLTAIGAVTWAAGTLLGRITASGKMTAYTSAAVDGSEVPIEVLRDEVVFDGAGDLAGRPLVSGKVRRGKLVAHGVGAVDQVEVDQLRDYTIIAQRTTQLAELDNQ